ncbi:MAG TPA: epoxide hydrolase N-terminal domain-containing protein, partial [Mucilaginibacter sp.]|nr:epoxide hydrolase N-terminal domain-containing protein [Mucilaginibacter sp.]
MKKNKCTLVRKFITGALILLTGSSFAQTTSAAGSQASDTIRPFHVNIPEAALTDLRQRVLATRWPDKETVTDRSQGVKLDQIQN